MGGLALVKEESLTIEADDKYPDSFAAVYSGDNDKTIYEARRISRNLDLSVVSDTGYSFAAKGVVDICSVVISVSSNTDEYLLKYGVSKLN